jgi:hypothetical protein
VQLEQVDRLDPEIRSAHADVLTDIVAREGLRQRRAPAARPLPILRRDFGRREEPLARVRGNQTSQQSFTVAVAVCVRRVEEVDTLRHGKIERCEGLGIIRSRPLAHAPHAVADLADLPASPPKCPMAHLQYLLATDPAAWSRPGDRAGRSS